jgi:adenylate cyclase
MLLAAFPRRSAAFTRSDAILPDRRRQDRPYSDWASPLFARKIAQTHPAGDELAVRRLEMAATMQGSDSRAAAHAEAERLYQQARQLRATGKSIHNREIVQLCRNAVELDPGFARAWALMAVCQTLLGFDAAAGEDGTQATENALTLDPNLGEAHAVKGRLLVGAGRAAEAKPEIERALQLDPEAYDVNAAAARYFIATKNYGDAIRHLAKCEAVNPQDVWAGGMALQCHEARGDNLGARKAAEQAMQRIDKVLATDPEHGDALGFGVTAFIRLGRPQKALDWAERALQLNPDSRNLRYNMACAMVQMGRFDRAIELLEPVAEAAGRQGIEWFKVDTDLDPIRKSPRFKALLERAEARLAASAAA